MNKSQVKDIESLEEYYNKCRKIKFASFEPKSIEDLFFAVSKQQSNLCNNSTVYSKGALHCHNGRHRSICDYIKLAKYYYPDKSVKEILNVINNNLDKPNPYNTDYGPYVRLGYCSIIRKNNFFSSKIYQEYNKNYLAWCKMSDNGFINFPKRIQDLI